MECHNTHSGHLQANRFALSANRVLCLFILGATGERALLSQAELRSQLGQFTQIDGWYQHWLNQFVFSDGVKWLCDQCECRWLLSDIAFFQLRIRTEHQQLEPFQIWHFKRLPGNLFILECKGGSGQQTFIRDELESVEFALDEITLWLVNGMLLLPSEYAGFSKQSPAFDHPL